MRSVPFRPTVPPSRYTPTMALAEPPTDPPAPGRPGAEGRSTEARTVAQFLDQHYEVAPLDNRVDAAAFHRALLAWADERTLPPPGRTLTYATVRQRGVPVERGGGNVLQIRGIRPRPFAQQELARLEGRHHRLHLAQRADQEHQTMTRDVATQARALAEEAIAQLLVPAFEALRAGLVDPDVRVRLQASEAVLSRAVPKVKVRETAEDAIDVLPVAHRPALVELEAVLNAREEARVSPEDAQDDDPVQDHVDVVQGSNQGSPTTTTTDQGLAHEPD